jgi:hypothetical protein
MQEEASEFAGFVGIDWADRKHDVCLQVAGVQTCEVSILEHRPSAIEAWAHKLRERFEGQRVAVCLELSQGPIVSALLEYDIFVIFPVKPSIRILFRCWVDRTPYNESRYLSALQKRHSPLITFAAHTPS